MTEQRQARPTLGDPTGRPIDQAGPADLTPEELAEAQAIELPDREALSIVTGGLPSGAGSSVAAGTVTLDGSGDLGIADTLSRKPEDPT
jgi:hypothetical protein